MQYTGFRNRLIHTLYLLGRGRSIRNHGVYMARLACMNVPRLGAPRARRPTSSISLCSQDFVSAHVGVLCLVC